MAILDHSITLKTHFICASEADTAPAQKRKHRIDQPFFWDSKKCARVEVSVGTHPTTLRRHMLRGYEGPCPTSPVMLGIDASSKYAEGLAGTTTFKLVKSLVCAVVIGALLGLAGAAAIGGVSAALARLGLAMTWQTFTRVLVASAVVGACLMGTLDVMDYRRAHQRFVDLRTLSDAFVRQGDRILGNTDDVLCKPIIKKAYAGTDWALREAAVEFDAIQQSRWVSYVTDPPDVSK